MKLPCVLLSVLVALPGAGALAQNAADAAPEATRFEATAFAGYRGGGTFDIHGSDENGDVREHFSFALAFDFLLDHTAAYELFYSQQHTQVSVGADRTDLDVRYLMAGGSLLIEDPTYLRPYIVGLIGAARLSPDAPDAGDASRLALGLGLGVRVPLRPNLDVRLEARGYMTFVDKNSSVFCQSDETGGACLLRGNSSTFLQGEVLAGIAYAF